MSRAADEAGLPADPEFRAALVGYLERGTRLDALEDQDDRRVQDSYGPEYRRPAAVKAEHDPDNVFHRNADIKAGMG